MKPHQQTFRRKFLALLLCLSFDKATAADPDLMLTVVDEDGNGDGCNDLVGMDTEGSSLTIGEVCATVVGDHIEVGITATDSGCCLKETHICNVPGPFVDFGSEECAQVKVYNLNVPEYYGFTCTEEGEMHQIDGHASIICDSGSPDPDPPAVQAMYWVMLQCEARKELIHDGSFSADSIGGANAPWVSTNQFRPDYQQSPRWWKIDGSGRAVSGNWNGYMYQRVVLEAGKPYQLSFDAPNTVDNNKRKLFMYLLEAPVHYGYLPPPPHDQNNKDPHQPNPRDPDNKVRIALRGGGWSTPIENAVSNAIINAAQLGTNTVSFTANTSGEHVVYFSASGDWVDPEDRCQIDNVSLRPQQEHIRDGSFSANSIGGVDAPWVSTNQFRPDYQQSPRWWKIDGSGRAVSGNWNGYMYQRVMLEAGKPYQLSFDAPNTVHNNKRKLFMYLLEAPVHYGYLPPPPHDQNNKDPHQPNPRDPDNKVRIALRGGGWSTPIENAVSNAIINAAQLGTNTISFTANTSGEHVVYFSASGDWVDPEDRSQIDNGSLLLQH